ncbi:MAG: hypothetical protein H6577_05550 [Lewinellaceae bacterium]|nr:hypothetical protein [Saprospiraceae bacterium]MCB9337570.1 hypothetical protein [Lewinellaceae bacterium]
MKKEITIQLHCKAFPGKAFGTFSNVHLGIQKGKETVEETSCATVSKVFNLPIFIKEDKEGRPDFSGEFVHGKLGDRFLYLVWFEKEEWGKTMFRRGKIKLQHLTWERIQAAIAAQKPIATEVFLTDKKGGPVCATLKAENIRWL